MSRWTEGLNADQQAAVLATEGPLLILAGAGSGKTTVLVSRTGRLLDDLKVQSSRVCVLTFTNKAARELKHRVKLRLGPKFGKQVDLLMTGTFHSFGLRWLKAHPQAARLPQSFGVIDSSDSEGILRELLKLTRSVEKESFRLDRLFERMNQLREHRLVRELNPKAVAKESPGIEAGSEYDEMARAILPRYLDRLDQLGVTDFTGLIERPIEALMQSDQVRREFQAQFDYLMVDEFQDTNRLQLEFVRELSKGTGHIAVVGDDDQAIYGWRGAEVQNILNFPKEFSGAQVIRLEENYRSSRAILDLANAVIAKNEKRHGKTLRKGKKQKDDAAAVPALPEFFEYDNEDTEAEQTILRIGEFIEKGIPHREIAVLYRSNSQGSLIEAELRRNQIPYQMTGGQAFFDRREVKDILAFLRCSVHPNELNLRRLFVTPPRGIGDGAVQKIEAIQKGQKKKFVEVVLAIVKDTERSQDPDQFQLNMAEGPNSNPGSSNDQSALEIQNGDSSQGRRMGSGMHFQEGLSKLFGELELLRKGLLKPGPLLRGQSPGERLLEFLKQNGYQDFMRSLHKGNESFESHWFVVTTLAKVFDSFLAREEGELSLTSILRFVDRMELRDDDSGEDESQAPDGSAQGSEPTGKVQLLTLHACKGLEFDAVCLIGCEEEILPHRTLGLDIAEERRLFYVGVTRARQLLVLSRAKARKRYGRAQVTAPSRFVLEIPDGMSVRFADGVRPLVKEARKSRIDELFKKMDSRVAAIAKRDGLEP